MLFRATKGKFNAPIKPAPFPFCYKQELPSCRDSVIFIALTFRIFNHGPRTDGSGTAQGENIWLVRASKSQAPVARDNIMGEAHGKETTYNQWNRAMKGCTTDLCFVLGEGGIHTGF